MKVYPSGESLVIGALLDIDLPDRWLDVSGWVYLKTKPTPTSGGTAIKLESPSFSRAINNEIWSLVSVILEDTIKQEIERQGLINLQELIKQTKEIITIKIAKQHKGFAINISDPEIRLGRIAVAVDHLFIEGIFHSKADISLLAF